MTAPNPTLPTLAPKVTATRKPQPNLPGMRGFMGHTLPEPMALLDGQALVVTIPGIELKSQNQNLRGQSRGALMAKVRRAHKQREDVTMVLQSRFGKVPPAPPLTITLTRIAPGTLDAHDSLPPSFKHVADAVAAWIGLDDADKRLTWKYDQRRDGRSYGITIRIEARAA